MRTLNIPIARDRYDRSEEQVFRERVRRAIEDSVSRESLFNPTTGRMLNFGITHSKMVGTNAALSVAASTITHLPLPTISISHPNLIDAGEFKAKYAMDVEITYNIYHSVAGAGNADVTAYLSLWNGTTYPSELFSELNSMDMTKLWGLSKTVMLTLTTGQMVRLRVQHTDSGANTFDLTKSFMTIRQLSVDPTIMPKAVT